MASAVSKIRLYVPGVLAVLAGSGREGDEESRHESGELHFVGLFDGGTEMSLCWIARCSVSWRV